MVATAGLETRRVALQVDLDSQKTGAERNVAGQFATPTELAAGMLRHAKSLANYAGGIRFLDPAVGTGSFYSALLKAFPKGSVGTAVGYEIDRHYGVPAALLWEGSGLEVRLRDFTRARAPEDGKKFNMIICNPPYVRHHHIPKDEKPRLRARALRACGTEIGGLAGLYCYFIGLAHAWMDDGAVAGWLVPSEFMDVNYGAPIRRYLLDRVTLLHIHRFDPADVQFGDALVSSAVVWYSKSDPPRNHAVRFTYGGSLSRPALDRMVPARALREAAKWTRYPARDQCGRSGGPVLGDFFNIKRGLATGCNGYFIVSPQEMERRGLPVDAFVPILPSPRYLQEMEVRADGDGNPLVERRVFLLDCRLDEGAVARRHPELWSYLKEGEDLGIAERYLCRHREPWYLQESRPPAPFVCTYIGRRGRGNGRPFRFILNHSRATASNNYLMLYPKGRLAKILESGPAMKRAVLDALNGIHTQDLLDCGRVYGGELFKMEPGEMKNVPAGPIASLFSTPLPAGARDRLGSTRGIVVTDSVPL